MTWLGQVIEIYSPKERRVHDTLNCSTFEDILLMTPRITHLIEQKTFQKKGIAIR